jgi:hypothetical protein
LEHLVRLGKKQPRLCTSEQPEASGRQRTTSGVALDNQLSGLQHGELSSVGKASGWLKSSRVCGSADPGGAPSLCTRRWVSAFACSQQITRPTWQRNLPGVLIALLSRPRQASEYAWNHYDDCSEERNSARIARV